MAPLWPRALSAHRSTLAGDSLSLPRLPTHDGQRLLDDPGQAGRRFAVIAGEPVIGGMHGDTADHHRCDWCGSWMFTRPRAAMGFINVRAMLLDDPYRFAPWLETQTAEKLSRTATGAERRFERVLAVEEYQALIAAYRTARSIG